MAAPPGQLIALQTFNAVKEILSGYETAILEKIRRETFPKKLMTRNGYSRLCTDWFQYGIICSAWPVHFFHLVKKQQFTLKYKLMEYLRYDMFRRDLTVWMRKYEIPKCMKLTDWRSQRHKARQVGNPQNTKLMKWDIPKARHNSISKHCYLSKKYQKV